MSSYVTEKLCHDLFLSEFILHIFINPLFLLIWLQLVVDPISGLYFTICGNANGRTVKAVVLKETLLDTFIMPTVNAGSMIQAVYPLPTESNFVLLEFDALTSHASFVPIRNNSFSMLLSRYEYARSVWMSGPLVKLAYENSSIEIE